MIMSPGFRKLALTAHVTSSVGWIGAAGAFLAIAVVGFSSENPQAMRGAYLVMEPAAWGVLVPLAFASLLSGLVMSLATTWGLFRYYWVVFKLAITVFCTSILLIYMGTFQAMAGVASDPGRGLAAIRNPSPIVHAVLALLLLLAANALAIYKPLGLTPYGARKQLETRGGAAAGTAAVGGRWDRYVLVGIVVMFTMIVLWHLAGGGPRGH